MLTPVRPGHSPDRQRTMRIRQGFSPTKRTFGPLGRPGVLSRSSWPSLTVKRKSVDSSMGFRSQCPYSALSRRWSAKPPWPPWGPFWEKNPPSALQRHVGAQLDNHELSEVSQGSSTFQTISWHNTRRMHLDAVTFFQNLPKNWKGTEQQNASVSSWATPWPSLQGP